VLQHPEERGLDKVLGLGGERGWAMPRHGTHQDWSHPLDIIGVCLFADEAGAGHRTFS